MQMHMDAQAEDLLFALQESSTKMLIYNIALGELVTQVHLEVSMVDTVLDLIIKLINKIIFF